MDVHSSFCLIRGHPYTETSTFHHPKKKASSSSSRMTTSLILLVLLHPGIWSFFLITVRSPPTIQLIYCQPLTLNSIKGPKTTQLLASELRRARPGCPLNPAWRSCANLGILALLCLIISQHAWMHVPTIQP